MAKYRKKPVVIEAEPYREGLEDGFDCECKLIKDDCSYIYDDGVGIPYNCPTSCEHYKPYIKTLEGNMYIEPTDMIITGVKGERYPCKKDIFDMTYEKAEG